MPDDHSELEPPLPIPNRTVKRYRADDSAATSVKVGYRQAIISKKPLSISLRGFFYILSPLLPLIQRLKMKHARESRQKSFSFLAIVLSYNLAGN